MLRLDVLSALRRDCSAYNPRIGWLRLLAFEPSIKLLFWFRISQSFGYHGSIGRVLARLIKVRILKKFSCDISMASEISPGVVFPHPIGIVIGEGVIIGSGSRVYQNVTIGRRSHSSPSSPRISENVTIYAGAVVVGGICVNSGSIIGANCVVSTDLPEGTRVSLRTEAMQVTG